MIPTPYKILGSLLAVAAILSGTFWFGMDYQKGKTAKVEVKAIAAKVENHNEDTSSIKKDTIYVAEKQKPFKKELANIPMVDVSAPCPLPDHERMYNQAIRAANNVHFED